ncbi:thiopeptide-type bacteriocin biosynthesis protein [Algoriphagus aquimarinus]|uniref:thiopeptide-type bacteriocin biosynthesis protein n=1 Tax=Algoriphagus aquimarinus TaxID=237018 RepID=UPI0030DCAE40|tara:strand:+ start:2682 stop:5267 length:2586 start_codon:yes stop_codon:yes gene_type:complete
MDFLYRMHLVDFDPKDKLEIRKNWDWIKEAIRLSSDSLFQEIEKKEFDSLCSSTQTKIHKYLLRGRYRSTPFGLWAGVGIGMWGGSNNIGSLAYRKIENLCFEKPWIQSLTPSKYKVAPGLKVYAEQVQFWSYCIQEEGWRISYLDKNPLILILLAYFEKSEKLDIPTFQQFFKSKNKNQVADIWKMVLESGFLIPESFPELKSPLESEGMDIRITSEIKVNRGIQEKLENLISEIGNLFVPVQSDFLRNFKSWFSYTFDDRFVPIGLLAHRQDLFCSPVNESITKERDEYQSEDILSMLWGNAEEFDLSNCFESKSTDLHHLQIAFKLVGETELYVENLVCNRPFAYSGRFSLDPEIKNLVVDKVESLSEEALYADIILFETSKSNHISRHENAFRYSIYPFGKGVQENQLGVEDLLVGIRRDRLILYSQKLNKEVLPVVQHPLNPNQISHTLSRLIWEIGNQDQQRFIPYHNTSFQQTSYTPRLTWKGVILQGRKWILHSKKYSDKRKLFQFLAESKIPCPLLAGYLDRELILDWEYPPELEILWEELNKLKELTVFECPWKERSPFRNKSGQSLYPQLIYSWKGKDRIIEKIDSLNRVGSIDESWIYLRIGIKEEGLLPLLLKPLPSILRSIIEKSLLQKWYFLCYNSPKPEIRLRLLPAEEAQKQAITAELKQSLMETGWVITVDSAPYYPEYEKYKLTQKGIVTSESIFHLESELILLGNEKQRDSPMLTWDVIKRQNWICESYFYLIEMTGRKEIFFHYFQRLIKEIPVTDRKELSKADYSSTEYVTTYPIEIFLPEFSKIATEQDEVLMRLIPNHLHMCCNRTFPRDTIEYERKVIYSLYKRLGRSIYGRLNSL